MNKVLELGYVLAGQLPTEHFFVVSGEATVLSVLERMRDDACPVAVFVENDKVVGTVTAEVVLEKIVGQPAVWTQPVRSLAVPTPALSASTSAREVQKLVVQSPGYVVVTNESGPALVVSRATWMRFLNTTYNTMIFNQGPESERAIRERPPVPTASRARV